MAYDKAVDSTALENGLTTIADAIRSKGGTSAPLAFPQGMADAIAAISGGGGGGDYTQFVIDLLAGKIKELSSPLVEYVSHDTFNGWDLQKVNFPNAHEFGTSAFYKCEKLTTCNVSNIEVMGNGVFQYCGSLLKLDFHKLSSMGYHCFYNTKSLKTLIIRTNKVVALTVPIGGSAINEGTGFVYVPKSLVEQYKAATNWAKIASQFRAIEDYPEITGGAK